MGNASTTAADIPLTAICRLDMDCSAKSEQTNKSRLRILQTREHHLQELFDGARGRLTDLVQDQGKYQGLLTGLILQVRVARCGSDGIEAFVPETARLPSRLINLTCLLQGLLQLMEDKVTVTCKSTDVQLTQKAAQEAEKAYTEKSGRKTKVEVKEGLDKDR